MFTTKAFAVWLGLPIARKAFDDRDGGLEVQATIARADPRLLLSHIDELIRA
ncbi:MAG: hypothetical protein OET44_04855 [Gammaproteobacteria bacterium]|nr:hypothetical protein [Gammaproteobacteria bacterium]